MSCRARLLLVLALMTAGTAVAQERVALIGEAADYFAENGKRKSVKTLGSGLQYEVLRDGVGPSPKLTDTVSVHYQGHLLNGTEFDSSYKRGEPASFRVEHVIKGWTEALQLMRAGSKWRLYIPSHLAWDLFRPAKHIRDLEPVLKAKLEFPKLSLKKLAAHREARGVKINYQGVKRTLGYKRLMEAAGLAEPYRELAEAPARASRWLKRPAKERPPLPDGEAMGGADAA